MRLGGRWAITVVVIAALQIQEADYTYVLKIKSSVTVALSLLIECDTHIVTHRVHSTSEGKLRYAIRHAGVHSPAHLQYIMLCHMVGYLYMGITLNTQ